MLSLTAHLRVREAVSNLCDTEIVDILSGIVDCKLVVNLKTPGRSGVKRSNTNNTNVTETPTCFNKFRPSENGRQNDRVHVNRA